MKIVSTSYSKTADHTDPGKWLDRINFYTGILEELAKRNEVVSFERIEYEGEIQRNNVLYKFVKFNQEVNRFPRKMHRMIREINPDLVLVNGLIFPMQVMQLRRYLKTSARILVLHRAERPGRGVQGFLQRKADAFIDGYLFSSQAIGMKWHKQGIIRDKRKIHEIIQASSSFKQAFNRERNFSQTPVFIWAGRLDTNKDPITLLKAFVRFAKEFPSVKLDMIYQSDELLEQVKALAAGIPQVQLRGIQPHHAMEKWYQQSDFVVSTSHYEGAGIAVMEGMSCGCIPILSRIDSFTAMTGNGECGILFQPGNEEELLNTLRAAMKIDRKQASMLSLQQFEEHLSFPAISAKIEKLYTSLIKRNHAGALAS